MNIPNRNLNNKKCKNKSIFLLFSLLIGMLLLAGCSAAQTSASNAENQLLLKAPDPPAGEFPKILFVGNSHTYTNNLPGTFYELTYAMGHESDVYELSEGAYTLESFADTSDELGSILDQALAAEEWDFVILQENTNNAFSSPEQNMYPYARILDEKIRAANGQTVFLMTWSPEAGVSMLSREQVQSKLSESYITISSELDSLLIPGGDAFMRCIEHYPEIGLWDEEDGQHPSPEGTYLAACTAYAILFQESPAGCSYTAGLDNETAGKLQEIAGKFLSE